MRKLKFNFLNGFRVEDDKIHKNSVNKGVNVDKRRGTSHTHQRKVLNHSLNVKQEICEVSEKRSSVHQVSSGEKARAKTAAVVDKKASDPFDIKALLSSNKFFSQGKITQPSKRYVASVSGFSESGNEMEEISSLNQNETHPAKLCEYLLFSIKIEFEESKDFLTNELRFLHSLVLNHSPIPSKFVELCIIRFMRLVRNLESFFSSLGNALESCFELEKKVESNETQQLDSSSGNQHDNSRNSGEFKFKELSNQLEILVEENRKLKSESSDLRQKLQEFQSTNESSKAIDLELRNQKEILKKRLGYLENVSASGVDNYLEELFEAMTAATVDVEITDSDYVPMAYNKSPPKRNTSSGNMDRSVQLRDKFLFVLSSLKPKNSFDLLKEVLDKHLKESDNTGKNGSADESISDYLKSSPGVLIEIIKSCLEAFEPLKQEDGERLSSSIKLGDEIENVISLFLNMLSNDKERVLSLIHQSLVVLRDQSVSMNEGQSDFQDTIRAIMSDFIPSVEDKAVQTDEIDSYNTEFDGENNSRTRNGDSGTPGEEENEETRKRRTAISFTREEARTVVMIKAPWEKLMKKKTKAKGVRKIELGMLQNALISDIYMKKVISERDALVSRKLGGNKKRAKSLAKFVDHYFTQKYGLKKLAEEYVVGLISSINQNQASSTKSTRIELFGMLLGVIDCESYTECKADVVVEALALIFEGEFSKIQPKLSQGEGSTFISLEEATSCVKKLFLSNRSLSLDDVNGEPLDVEALRSQAHGALHKSWTLPMYLKNMLLRWIELSAKTQSLIKKEVEKKQKRKTNLKAGNLLVLDLDDFLKRLFDTFSFKIQLDRLIFSKLFETFDFDGNGVLSFEEFTALVEEMMCCSFTASVFKKRPGTSQSETRLNGRDTVDLLARGCLKHGEAMDILLRGEAPLGNEDVLELWDEVNALELDDDLHSIEKESFASVCVQKGIQLPYWKLEISLGEEFNEKNLDEINSLMPQLPN